MSNAVTREQLKNGMWVLLKEIHTAPIISHWVWYRVGSRNEKPGTTGISHWVEHMQFKGTPTFPAGMLDKAISRDGGFWNAMTYIDWTTYFETMPADKIDLALQLEADRMMNSAFAPEEVGSERTVVISERQGNENSPLFRLDEEMQAAAFRIHPYHHEVIGDQIDLETMTREQLYAHYRTYYVPNNAVLAIAGDFETTAMLKKVKAVFGEIPTGNEPPRNVRAEPAHAGERRVTVEGPGETTFVRAAYRSPQASNPDFFILTVLDSLLTGPSSVNLFGGGISNKTSRLYETLVDNDLAVGVSGGLQATIDPFLYSITITVHPEKTAEETITVLDEELEKARQKPPQKAELERAVKQARALFAYGSESITNQGFWLGFAEMFADYDWFLTYLDKLADVTPKDVQAIADKYLRPQNRVLGVYQPTGNGVETE